jgi:hypothetical protein
VRVRDWDGPGSLAAFIIDRNLERRHLSESQRALLAVKLKEALEEEGPADVRPGRGASADLPKAHTRDRAAAAVNVSPRLVGAAAKVTRAGAPELIAAVARDEVSVSAAEAVVALGREEQAALVARGPATVRDKARQLRAAKAKDKPARPVGIAKCPDDAGGGRTTEAGGGRLLPAPGWLERHPVRSRLAAPAAFDFAATLWWVAQELLDRFGLPRGEEVRRARALFASLDPDLMDLAILTEGPEIWTACILCKGEGREDDEACSSCHGRGFRAVQIDPVVPAKGKTLPAATRRASGAGARKRPKA